MRQTCEPYPWQSAWQHIKATSNPCLSEEGADKRFRDLSPVLISTHEQIHGSPGRIACALARVVSWLFPG